MGKREGRESKRDEKRYKIWYLKVPKESNLHTANVYQ